MGESLDRVEQLFSEALRCPPAEREQYLQIACAGDQTLLSEVGTLLRAQAAGRIPEGPSPDDAAVAGSAIPEESLGARIGAYRLSERLGEGGCGTVYLAEQAEPIHRQVALKVIKLGMDTREVIARFEAERQTLALMEHSNIARVFECGATARGRPYFVMELVRGTSITRFCDERGLGLAARLELLIPVCRAIHHAHERGVVHRDIKPSNVLVAISDGQPVPKVIDFGIAKATEEATPNQAFTAYDQIVGTPLYMSPEQAALGSAATDARSDIYSLGVLLYELLAGRTPFDNPDGSTASFEEIRRRLRAEDPLSPSRCLASLPPATLTKVAASRRMSPPRLKRLVRGELDWIVDRCLERDPARRYASARDLAEDLERHLRREPVLASPPGAAIRMRRFVHRHRTGLRLAGAGAAVALAAAGSLMWLRSQRVVRLYSAAEMEQLIDSRSIAVLPFSNLSPDPSVAYFADGMHEDLINNLAKIHDLKVISRTSVMAYRAKTPDLRAVGNQFGVRNILEGTVRRSGDTVRVTAELFDATSERPIWAETYDRKITEIFAIQSELALRIAQAMEASLTPGERQLIGRRPTRIPAAYDLYLRARALDDQLGSNGTTVEQYQPVLELYRQAVALDPSFALAYVQIATVDLKLYWYSRLDPSPARLAEARAAIDAAIQLAPNQPETHLAVGHLYYNVALDWPSALREFQAAEAGMPNDDQAIFGTAIALRRLGRWSEAADHFILASARNPQSSSEAVASAETLSLLRRYPQALDFGRAALGRFPTSRPLAEWVLCARYELDRDREAFLRGWEVLPRSPDDPLGLFDRFQAAAFRSDWKAADSILSDPRMGPKADFAGVTVDPPAFYRSMIACIRGDRTSAGRFADQAIAYYRGRTWNDRQHTWVLSQIASAEAYAGRSEQAARDAEAAWSRVAGRDAQDAVYMRMRLATVYLTAGRRSEALALLAKAMSEPCPLGPQRIRLEPFWSALSGDPGFEAALRSTRSL